MTESKRAMGLMIAYVRLAMAARETILKRRALFIASALGGLAARDAHAQDAEDHEQQPQPPTPDPRPYACLIPPQPPDRPSYNGIDLAVGCAPSVLAPSFTGGAVGFAAPIHLGLRRDLTRSFDLSLLATVMPAHSRDTFAPVGGVLRLGTTAITPEEWGSDMRFRLFNTIDVGGGAWLAPVRTGATAEEPVPTRGAFVSVGATLLGFRYSFDRAQFGREGSYRTFQKRIDVGIPLALFITTQRGGTEERLAPSWFTLGLGVTFYLQLKAPSTYIDDRRAAR